MENGNDDNEDDNMALMQEHFATMHPDENKTQLYDEMHMMQQFE